MLPLKPRERVSKAVDLPLSPAKYGHSQAAAPKRQKKLKA